MLVPCTYFPHVMYAVKHAVALSSTDALRSTEIVHRVSIETVANTVEYAMSPSYNLPIPRDEFINCVGSLIRIGDRIGGFLLDIYSNVIEWCSK